MAAEEGPLSKTSRGSRLATLLGAAFVACLLAFAWVATPPSPPSAAVPGAGAAFVKAPPPAKGPTPAVGSVDRVPVSVMTLGNELKPEQIAEFEALNPDIQIVYFEFSANLLDILIATHDLPDVFRLAPAEHLSLVRRGLLLDITDRVAQSKVLQRTDLRPEAMDEVTVDGRCYGVPQALSTPDFSSLYINTSAFENAGIALPSPREPMSYAELAVIAKQLAGKTGRPAFYSYFFERAVTATLAQRGVRMFNEDFTEMKLTRNPKALEVMRYFYDLGVSGAMHIPPATPGIAFLFEKGELPISQSGYWMGAVITPDTPARGHVTMLPAPVWDRSLPRVSTYLGGTRLVISSESRHPDHAYRFIEWYTTGKPAADRARRGWGFPLLRSMEGLLPQASDFDRQRLRVAVDALALPTARLPEYPYPSIAPAFNQSWTRNMALARSGAINFAGFASNLQEDVNLAIQDDMTRSHAAEHR